MNLRTTRAGLLALALLAAPAAVAQGGGAYRIVSGRLTGGGETSQAGSLTLKRSLLPFGSVVARGGAFALEGGLRATLSHIAAPTPCMLTCPPDLSVPCTAPDGAVVNYPLPTLAGDCPPGTTVECLPASGTRFPPGPTIVQCRALNAQGQQVAECKFTITVTGDCAPPLPPQVAAWRKLKQDSLIEPLAYFDHGIPTSLEVKIPHDPKWSDPMVRAVGFIEQRKELFQLKEPAEDLFLKRVERDGNDQSMIFGFQCNGLRVFGAEVAVHLDAQVVKGTSGRWVADEMPSAAPAISAAEAVQVTRAALGQDAPVFGDVQLMFLNEGLLAGKISPTHLVWCVHAAAHHGVFAMFVDAQTSDLRLQLNLSPTLDTAKQFTIRSALNRQLGAFCGAFDGNPEWFNEVGTRFEYPGAGGDNLLDGRDAASAAVQTWDYFFDNFGTRGWNRTGGRLNALVDHGGLFRTATQDRNARWSPMCGHLEFGEGFVTLDIFAHEFAHAVTHDSAGLVYQDQSGALNESYSDVFGSLVDSSDWFIGEGLVPGTLGTDSIGNPIGGPLRDMRNPLNGGQPDHMRNLRLRDASGTDNGWVHINSGIPNKVAYLLIQGDTHNGFTIPSLGRAKVQRLYFDVLTRRLTASSQFIDARNETVAQARDYVARGLFGFVASDVCTVLNAFASVGLGSGDIDCDGRGDDVDLDDDNDGVPDARDLCRTVPNTDQRDSDGDGFGDACDPDRDGDGVPNSTDRCPDLYDPLQRDLNNNGIGDACEDSDGDGVLNALDNCPNISNPGQEDLDGDRIGDACDPDLDGDGVPNGQDKCPRRRNPDQADTDGDGRGDVCDICPSAANPGQEDLDRDGIGDVCDRDRDGDGWPNALPDEVPGPQHDNCPDVYNPSQGTLDTNNDNVPCDEPERIPFDWLNQQLEGHIRFLENSEIRIPFEPCRSCPIADFERVLRVQVGIAESVAVRVEDDRGFWVAGGEAGGGHNLEFVPRPDSFSIPPVNLPAFAEGEPAFPPGNAGRAALQSSYIGTRYYLVFSATEQTPRNAPLPWTLAIGEAPPPLQVTLAAGNAILRWRDPGARFTLESVDLLNAAPLWKPAPGDALTAGEDRLQSVPRTAAEQFFRLRLKEGQPGAAAAEDEPARAGQ